MRRESPSQSDLLAAYVDGVTELSPDERRGVEALLDDPAAKRDEQSTRALIGQLRELPPAHGEPDWTALERSINQAVGPSVPRSWWRGWRWVVPGLAIAATAAILLFVHRDSEPVLPVAGNPSAPLVPSAAERPAPDTVALWLDGRQVDVGLDADDLLEDPLLGAGDPGLLDEGLLSPADLAWASEGSIEGSIEELDEDSLQRAERALEQPHHRKKS